MSELATTSERQRCIDIAVGCLDYLGGYRGADLTVYHHGIQTVINALSGDQSTYQLRVVAAMGREAVKLVESNRDILAALKALMPKGWGKDDTMDHMPGVRLARLAIAKAEGK